MEKNLCFFLFFHIRRHNFDAKVSTKTKTLLYAPEIKVEIWFAETFFHVSFTSLQPVIKEKDA